jgi:hypothetical protein
MKVEGETAYEPDLLVLMSRREDVVGQEKKVWREAMVVKDRSTLIDGQTMINPKFGDFAPAIEYILENPQVSAAVEASATSLFEATAEDQRAYAIRRDILLEKIEGEMTAKWPGSSAEAKRAKVQALESSFGTKSWTEVSKLRVEQLESGLTVLVALVAHWKEAS